MERLIEQGTNTNNSQQRTFETVMSNTVGRQINDRSVTDDQTD